MKSITGERERLDHQTSYFGGFDFGVVNFLISRAISGATSRMIVRAFAIILNRSIGKPQERINNHSYERLPQYGEKSCIAASLANPHRECGIRLFLLVLLALPLLGSAVYRGPLAPAAYSRDPILQGPEAAACKTGVPEATLAGIRFAESSGRPNPQHPDPWDRGAYGLHETPAIHAERAALYGEYDPLDPWDAAYITARNYCDNLRKLGSEELAVAAHKQGVFGVRRDGVERGYVERVRRGR